METKNSFVRLVIIVAMVLVVTVMHYGASGSDLGLHLLHRELYFIPIVLAGFWFGLKGGA